MRITQKYINDLSYKIIGCAIEVHKILGPGLLENVYEKCLLEEFRLQGLNAKSQVPVPIEYKGVKLGTNLAIDILVEDLIVVELKSVSELIPIHTAQTLSYINLAKKPKGLLFNFNTDNIVSSLKSYVTDIYAKLPVE